MTTQAGLNAAYATEINSCTFNADLGPRVRSRDQEFCDSITVNGSTTLVGAMTAQSNTTTNGVATFMQPIVVQGFTFTPQLLYGVYVLASGPINVPAPPTPPTPPV